LNTFAEEKYETKLTKDLGEILSIQQKEFLATSSKVFSETNKELTNNFTSYSRLESASTNTAQRPISAKVLIKRSKNFIMKSVRGGRNYLDVQSEKVLEQKINTLSEQAVLTGI
jgi:hypothetical protein